MKAVATLLALLLVTPIWYYLLYQVLVRVEATELMWFLYWIYVPVGFFVSLILRLLERDDM